LKRRTAKRGAILGRICFIASLAAELGLAACVSSPDYQCASSTECVSADAEQGLCTAEHYCAYPDDSCGARGLRYSSGASSEIASVCVAPNETTSCLVQIATGIDFSCARKNDGSVWCWGANDHGQLGGSSPDPLSDVPVRVALPEGVQAVSVGCGEVHACALSASGGVFCWGGGDSLQLGLGSADAADHATPVEIMFPADASPIGSLTVGAAHTCVVDAAERVWCWGENDHEECGQRVAAPCPGESDPVGCEDVPRPTLLAEPVSAARFVVSGDEFTCAIDDLNELSCWGDNSLGELGLGVLDVEGGSSARQTPLPKRSGVGSFLTLDAVDGAPIFAAGAEHACVVVGGSVMCWGSNSSGQVGIGTKSASESAPLVVESARDVAAGCMAKHTCAIEGPSGRLSCWGNDADGQLGIGSNDDISSPTPLPLVGVQKAALGERHTCALVTGGLLYCWGANDKGQLGLPLSAAVVTPALSSASATICQ
jgi:alpha-tubulin suppressor-like RCC1 family protein